MDNPIYFVDPDRMLSESFMKRMMNSASGTAEYEAIHWENRVRGENGISLRTHYGNDTNGSVIGQALNPNATSSLYTQQLVMPTAHLQTQFTPSGMQVVPVSGTTTLVIPFKY